MASSFASIASQTRQWPFDAAQPFASPTHRALPIKKDDGVPLTRNDVQFDLLNHIFCNEQAVFTDPFSKKKDKGKVTFERLYFTTLYNSPRCSKVLKDKMIETPAFGTEFGKLALLVNVGRIDTTLAFFPEMKTSTRSYHPVPCLQKTGGNVQDAPRIKNCTKAALLPSESKGVPPATPEEILAKRIEGGQHPPTSVVNLITTLYRFSWALSAVHFDGNTTFLDLFIPGKRLSSYDRAQAFLWHLYHYLEDSKGHNPFADKFAQEHPGKAPQLRSISKTEARNENVDTEEEIKWGQEMTAKRGRFLRELQALEQDRKSGGKSAPLFISVTPGGLADSATQQSQRRVLDTPKEVQDASFLYYVPSRMPPSAAMSESELRAPYEMDRPASAHACGDIEMAEPSARRLRERSMINHAWLIAATTDPLEDSDGERGESEHTFLDYSRRLKVLSRLQGPQIWSSRRHT